MSGIVVLALSTRGIAGDPQFSERAAAAGVDVVHDTSGFSNAAHSLGELGVVR